MPINEKLKNIMTRIQNGLGIGNFQIPLYIGNLGIFAKKMIDNRINHVNHFNMNI
jgi:hypothetical protein